MNNIPRITLGMPAVQKVQYTRYGYLELNLNPIDEPGSVYFTDQSPRFELEVRNQTNRKITTKESSRHGGLRWVLALGPSKKETIATGDIELSIEPGGTQKEILEPGLLAYEGNAVLGVTGVSLYGNHQKEDGPIQFGVESHKAIQKILYTFTTWDRSHYEAVHQQPKRLQKFVVLFGGLTAVLAAIQIAIIAGIYNI